MGIGGGYGAAAYTKAPQHTFFVICIPAFLDFFLVWITEGKDGYKAAGKPALMSIRHDFSRIHTNNYYG